MSITGNKSTFFSFSIGNKGYIGTGRTSGNTQDFWEYDPTTNTLFDTQPSLSRDPVPDQCECTILNL